MRNKAGKLAWPVLIVVIVTAAGLGWQARKFEIDASADTLLTSDNKLYLETRLVERRYSPEEFILVAVQPTSDPLFSSESFALLRSLADDLRQIERVSSVRSVLNVPLPTLAQPAALSEFDIDGMTVEEAAFPPDAVATALDGHPIYEELLIDNEQTVTALQLLFRPNDELDRLHNRITTLEARAFKAEITDAEEAELATLKRDAESLERSMTETRNAEIERIREITARYEADADIYLGGLHVLGYQLVDIVKSDLVVFGSGVAIVIGILLLVLFRDFRWLLIAFASCIASILSTIGLFALLGLKATVISANFIALQLILTLAIVVHLIVQYREIAYSTDTQDEESIVRATMAAKTPPILYTGITTAIGFAALLASGIQPVISFGLMMIIAVAVSMAVTLTLFPALITVLSRPSGSSESRAVRRGLAGLADVVLAHRTITMMAAVAIFAFCVAGSLRLDLENSFINYFDEDTRVHQELTFIDQRLGGSTPLDIVYPIPPADAELIMSAESFLAMQKLDALFGRHEAVGKVMSLNNFTELGKEVNDGRPLTEYEITAFYRMMDDDLRESLLGSWFSPDPREVRFSLRIQDSTEGLDRGALLQALREDTSTVLGDDAEYQLSNLFVLYQDILERLFRSQVLTLGIVFLAITITFLLIFRSLRIALIAIVPNLLVSATVFGLMGWFGIPLDLMTITIAAVAMGIAVDDTIHYVHRFQEENRDGDASAAAKASHTTVGFAVFYTTVIIICGFSSLAFSDFVPTAQFGILTAIALGSAFVFDMTVLPVLLARFASRTRQSD